jgi:hypothetical protein
LNDSSQPLPAPVSRISEVKAETSAASANAQWGGRFAAGPARVMSDINASIAFDQRMWRQDIQGSLAHAAMLGDIGVITPEDERAIADGLGAIGAGASIPGAAATIRSPATSSSGCGMRSTGSLSR